jgi:hypothetical protein
MVLWENHQTPRARPGLSPSLLTRPPPCTSSIVHDFVLLVSPPCGPHLVPPSTWSLKPSLLVSPSPGGPSRLKTFRARSSPATTRTRLQPIPAHLAKSQSNTHCQSLITEERSSIDHRDAPGPHGGTRYISHECGWMAPSFRDLGFHFPLPFLIFPRHFLLHFLSRLA